MSGMYFFKTARFSKQWYNSHLKKQKFKKVSSAAWICRAKFYCNMCKCLSALQYVTHFQTTMHDSETLISVIRRLKCTSTYILQAAGLLLNTHTIYPHYRISPVNHKHLRKTCSWKARDTEEGRLQHSACQHSKCVSRSRMWGPQMGREDQQLSGGRAKAWRHNHIRMLMGEGFMSHAGFASALDRGTDCRSKHSVFDIWLLINGSSL